MVLTMELLAREIPHRSQYLVGWRSGRYREHELVNQLRWFSALGGGEGCLSSHTGRFAREELYDMVRSEPMTVLPKRLGTSDVGFAKTCRRHGIPVPERGYSARIAVGQAANKEPLPAQQPEMRDVVRIRVDRREQKLKYDDINLLSA